MGAKHSTAVARASDINGNTAPSLTCNLQFSTLHKGLKKNINEYGVMGLTKLHLACEVGDVARVVTLLLLGSDPNLATTGSHGYTTPLLFAAANGHTLCVMALLQRGACPNGTDLWGNTAIFKASTYNHLDCVRALLKYGANPNIPNNWGAIPLQYSALQGHHKVVETLLDAGCDPNSRGEENSPPPLSAAALRGQTSVVRRLIDAGVNVNSASRDKERPGCDFRTPLYYAVSRKYFYDTPSVLAVFGLNESTRETARKECNYADCIHLLVQSGATVNHKCLEEIHTHMLYNRGNVLLKKVRLAMLLLRATLYDETMTYELECIFNDIGAMHSEKYSKLCEELMELIFIIGYTPAAARHHQMLEETFSDTFYKSFVQTIRSPRTLRNLSSLKVRECLPGNPLSSHLNKLNLPPLLEKQITFTKFNDCTGDFV